MRKFFIARFVVVLSVFLGGFSACSSSSTPNEGKKADSSERITVVTEDSSMKGKTDIATNPSEIPVETAKIPQDSVPKDKLPKKPQEPNPEDAPLVNLAEGMQKMGLVNIKKVDPSIQVDLKYSTKDNFMKEDVYGDLNDAYAQADVAKMLGEAQKSLKKAHPDLSLIVYDAARPFRVQKKMWEIVKNTPMKDYVAKPNAKGSMHNYGAAIDLSLVDKNGKLVDMGTPYDFLGALAQPKYEEKYIKEGKLTQQQVDNRLILRKAMEGVGFKVISNEWWHFNAYPDAVTLKKFKKII
ncbi:MAG: M15 family metallopeptidase [Bacteroidia bacterium]